MNIVKILHQWHDCVLNCMHGAMINSLWSFSSLKSHETEWFKVYLLDPTPKTLNYLSIQFHSYSVICRHIYRYNSTRWYICTYLTEVMKTRLLWFNIWKCKKEKMVDTTSMNWSLYFLIHLTTFKGTIKYFFLTFCDKI